MEQKQKLSQNQLLFTYKSLSLNDIITLISHFLLLIPMYYFFHN
jgi:hypothetical protein